MLELKFYWQPKQSHVPNDSIEISKEPPSSRDLTNVGGHSTGYPDDKQAWFGLKSAMGLQ